MKIRKVLMSILMVGIMCIWITPTKTQAALQANGNAGASYNINEWITGIRQMQATGGALGLTDSINETKLTSTNKNLDIHMQKNTEYGAMVILSASAYGNPNHIADGETTTGNNTGIKMNINKEWTAAGTTNTAATSMANASPRYKNQYTAPTYTEKVGDAVETIGGWHNATNNVWLKSDRNFMNERACLLRSYAGSVFSYYGFCVYEDDHGHEITRADSHYTKTWHSRAVVVVGSGI